MKAGKYNVGNKLNGNTDYGDSKRALFIRSCPSLFGRSPPHFTFSEAAAPFENIVQHTDDLVVGKNREIFKEAIRQIIL